MSELPGSVLFACSHNAIRSPMAENILRYFHGRRIYVQSAGVRPAELDPFAVAVMDEIGIDISRHRAAQLRPARRRLFRPRHLALARGPAQCGRADPQQPLRAAVLAMPDPSLVEGSRETRLDAYRAVRDLLMRRIRERFPLEGAPEL